MPERPAPMSLLFDVWLIMHSMTTLVDDALESSELSGDDFGLYSLLRRFGPATPTQIARWTGMKPTTVSFAVKRLVQRRHATQTPHPSDGRSYLVGLNDAGVAAHGSAGRLFLGAMEKLSAELGSDHREERASLQRIDAAFRAVLALDPRPYDLGVDHATGTWTLSYDGPALSPEHEGQVRGVHRLPALLEAPCRTQHDDEESCHDHRPHPLDQPDTTDDTDGDQHDRDMDEAVARIIEPFRLDRRIPGLSIAIADSGGLRHASASGLADLRGDRPATPETSYLWFSLTKIVTATAAVRLADEGRLDLDEPISRYFPMLSAAANVVHPTGRTAAEPHRRRRQPAPAALGSSCGRRLPRRRTTSSPASSAIARSSRIPSAQRRATRTSATCSSARSSVRPAASRSSPTCGTRSWSPAE